MLTLVKPLQETEVAKAISIDQAMRAKLPALPNPIVASWDERHRLMMSRGELWIIGPLELDPYLNKSGGYPFPDGVTDQLRRISQGGARFHRIAIAHEVDPKGSVSTLLPKLRSAGAAYPSRPRRRRPCSGRRRPPRSRRTSQRRWTRRSERPWADWRVPRLPWVACSPRRCWIPSCSE